MPEKTTAEVPRPVIDLFEKGKQAVNRDNLDYALDLFVDALKKEPGFFDCRQELRKAQLKKSGQKKGFFGKALGGANPNLAKAKVLMGSKPEEALFLAEKALNADANNVGAHRAVAEAAGKLDLPKTAVLSLEMANRVNPDDKDLGLALADAYMANRQGEKADAVLQVLMSKNPNDADLQKKYRTLSANRTLGEGGYDKLGQEGSSFREALKDEGESKRLEQEARTFKDVKTLTSMLEEEYAKLAAEPSVEQAKKVADIYFDLKDYTNANKYYRQILEVDSSDPELAKRVSLCTLKGFDQRLEQLDSSVEDYEDLKLAIEREKAEFQLDDLKKKVDRYPNELGLKFELGKAYFLSGKFTEATKEFQKSARDAKNRIQSYLYLGRCFAEKKMYDMAAKQLETAIEEKKEFDEVKKDIIYTYGTILEAMDKEDQAIEQYKVIYEADIDYRDVGDKVDAYYQKKAG